MQNVNGWKILKYILDPFALYASLLMLAYYAHATVAHFSGFNLLMAILMVISIPGIFIFSIFVSLCASVRKIEIDYQHNYDQYNTENK